MELTDGVALRYIARSAEEVTRLEEAVRSFPARIELSDLSQLGDGPKVFVTEAHGQIILRPHRCTISGTEFGEGVTVTSNSSNLAAVQHGGKEYCILNAPLYS